MNRVADKNVMIARRTTLVVVILRSQGVQQRKRTFLLQPLRDMALQAVCGVAWLVKGITIQLRHASSIPSCKANVAVTRT